ncbi:hypothetical protein [Halorientalis marina]|uniref:hypothetical protein n=1 Tax=Halorientalis marina TaxID=2931976 RepID=UPI001FF3F660|nr:hypothetical protein [Halorientalis marina]
MQNDVTCAHQSHGHDHNHVVQNPAEPPANPDPDYAIVLEEAIDQGRFRDGEAIVLCPGCGETAKRLYTGLSEEPVRIDIPCFECDMQLHRWSAVIAPNIRTAPPSVEQLREIVQAHWEHKFRIGVQNLGLPHTREFTEEVQELAEEWDWEWSVTCPLCDRSLDELNMDHLSYHHWSYTPDIGTSLCLHCHDFIHGGDDDDQASKQDWRAQKLGLRDFRDLAVIRLALRDQETHDVTLSEGDPAYARRLRTRYNIPLNVDRIVELVSDVGEKRGVREIIEKHGTSPTVAAHDIRPV